MEIAELDYKSHKTRDMYKQINHLAGGNKKKERFLKNDDGTLITSSVEIANRWSEYFDELLNCDEPDEVFSFDLEPWNEQDCPEPTLEEIKLQVKWLKNHKSPDEDEVQAELLKNGGEELLTKLWKLICQIWKSEKIPEEWKAATICPIHKKGSMQDLLEKVIRAMNVRPDERVKLQDSSIGLLAYADDLVLMEESPNALKSLFGRLQRMASKVGLQTNETKTEYMVVGRRETAGVYPSLNVRNYVFSRAKQFKYLGSVITEKNEIVKEISARILAGNRAYHGLAKLLGSRSLSRELKI
ncbi:uncharacterized protein LOC126844814 [Adelges cooleyi]|uniref:uncharacterized protein LOC126844814 n=1 Tax=Adelges cooleyi TaxID=133065 RepID=UPI0021803153|nr:uncharacterized protein LOC126844814 [Adelges cooleyi]